MSTAVEHDRGWAGARALAFISLVLLEALVVVFVCPFALTGYAIRWALQRAQDRVRPAGDVDPTTDLRAFYLAAS